MTPQKVLEELIDFRDGYVGNHKSHVVLEWTIQCMRGLIDMYTKKIEEVIQAAPEELEHHA